MAFLTLAAPAGAQPTYSLTELLAFAEISSPVLRVALGEQKMARAAIDSADAYPNPELEFSSGSYRGRVEGVRNGTGSGTILSQSVELPSVRGARRNVAVAGLDGSDAALDAARLALRARVTQAFFEVLRRQDESLIAEEERQLLEQIRNRVKTRVEVGEAPRYELIKAEAELLNASSASTVARFRVDEAKAALRAQTAAGFPIRFELVPEMPELVSLPEFDILQREVLVSHPLMRQARAETAQALARVNHERALRTPQPVLRAGYEQDPESRQWRLGMSLPLPLWNQRQGPIGEALGALHQAEARERQQEISLVLELESALTRLKIAQRQQDAIDGGLMREARAALSVAEASYRFGERGILDYLDAQRTLRTVRSNAIQARYDQLTAAIEIERLSGVKLFGVKR